MTSQNPVKGGVDGEGDLGEKEEESEPHDWVPVARRERLGGGQSAVDSETAAEALVGGSAPVGNRRRQVGEKLHGVPVKLSRGLKGSEDVWGGDSA